jgi:hypothetical protein
MENQRSDLNSNTEGKKEETQDTAKHTIFLNSHIRKVKDSSLKIRLQTLIKARGLSEKEFYKSLSYSAQVWYALSWGIWEANIETKVKVAKALEVDSSVIWQDNAEVIK